MWKIGNIEIKSKVVLGPMAGITSLAYRDFMKSFGVGLSYSEMVSDCGLDYGNHKTFEYIVTSSTDRPVGIQLFGSTIEKTVEAIDILENSEFDYDILDINLGCPVPKVTNAGAGSSWLKRPDELYEYMSAIVKKSTKPVTAKIRLGWDEESINFKDVVNLLEKAGVSAITIHARTKKQGYTGKANYEILKDLGKTMSIPLIISGDIFSPEAAKTAMEITGATAVMVARGGVGYPTLISEINTYLETGVKLEEPTLEENIQYLKQFTEMLVKEKGERSAMMIMRGLAPKFLSRYPGTKEKRIQLAQYMTSLDDFYKILM